MVQAATGICQHHWVLSEPRDDVIHAVCKRCRAVREYPARLETAERFDDYKELETSSQPLLGLFHDSVEESL